MALQVEDDNQKMLERLVNKDLFQRLQDNFCSANNMYLICMGSDQKRVTGLYGNEKELAFFRQHMDLSICENLAKRMLHSTVENVIEENIEGTCLKICGVTVLAGGKVQLVWLAVALIEERIREEDRIPDYMMRTKEHSFYKSIGFLEVLSKQLMAYRLDELIAQDAVLESVKVQRNLERQLRQSESMTAVVKMLESENGFVKIVDDILKEVCEYLEISNANLLQKSTDEKTVDMICEYTKTEGSYKIGQFQGIPVEEYPFFTGKPYMLSYDSMMPEEFEKFFEAHHIAAAIFLPIEVNEKVPMYLCFYEQSGKRIWEMNDIKFLNDVKYIIQGILAKRIAKNSLASSYASLEAILENVGCGIYVLDPEKRKLLYTNQKFQKLFHKTINAQKLDAVIYGDKEQIRTHSFEEMYIPDEERWFDVHKTKIDWVDGRRVILCTIYDVTDKKLYQKKIEKQANNDFLTGLFNRMRCEQDLEKYIKRTIETNGKGALLYLDLDDFKHINDGLGHQYGDVLLKAISHSLQRINGVESSCYRMGGDEFIIIVSNEQYYRLDRICQEISEIFTKPWLLKGEDYYCTMSMGVVTFPEEGRSVEEIIKKADLALYEAKKTGKNKVLFYNKQEDLTSYQRLDMEKNMRKATRNACEEFEVFYQPIVELSDEGTACCGAEALVRWNSQAMGFISPGEFIPLAEYLGLINPIGEYVLREAAKRCKYWNDIGHPDYKVNVNLSVVQLLQNDIVKNIKNVLEETRINPYNLTLEVTESLAVNDMDRMKKVLSEIKNLGVRVALDDFGTGYSSLNHIREMPIDVIKIDRCFIEHVAEDDFSDAFVKMVAELASTIGVLICVEGVETKEQYEVLKQMKIKMIQGYLYGKPMRVEEFEKEFL